MKMEYKRCACFLCLSAPDWLMRRAFMFRPFCSLDSDAEHSAQIDRVNFATCVANSYRNTTNYPRGVSFTATSDAYCTGTTPPPSLQPRPAVVVVVALIRGMVAVVVAAAAAAVVVARLPLLVIAVFRLVPICQTPRFVFRLLLAPICPMPDPDDPDGCAAGFSLRGGVLRFR